MNPKGAQGQQQDSKERSPPVVSIKGRENSRKLIQMITEGNKIGNSGSSTAIGGVKTRNPTRR